MRKLATVIVSGLLATACTDTVDQPSGVGEPRVRPPDTKDARRFARRALEASGAPGAIVGIGVGDRAPVFAAVGDRTSRRPLDASDTFFIASVTKAFTARWCSTSSGEARSISTLRCRSTCVVHDPSIATTVLVFVNSRVDVPDAIVDDVFTGLDRSDA